MSGAVTILVAKGEQDRVLIDNPEISFFRTKFKRHVNFAQCVLSQTAEGTPSPDSSSTCTFAKKGDMMSYIYLTKKDNGVLQSDITNGDIKNVEFLIGGQVIDSITTDQLVSMRNMNSKYPQTFRGSESPSTGELGFYNTYHYPLGFWFCEHWQSAIPLVGLQYHDVQIRISWGDTVQPSTISFEIWVNYIYLDTTEREYFANSAPKDSLMYQHSQTDPGNSDLSLTLPFNNPVAFLFGKVGTTDIFGQSIPNVTDKIQVTINGVDIVDQKELVPHYTIIPTMYHTTYGKWSVYDPILDITVTKVGPTVIDVVVLKELATHVSFVYPFCLICSQLQPTGSCNFSRVDEVRLNSTRAITKPIYARSYNVLRIDKGMGGLMYST